ncbi:MAG: V-type H(+)-translocating pyrophosphatase [Ignavibacteriales bacterium]|nr:V-type H(+)-translocating pyrophosphatase [Ignavibacteriales bacterium]
MLEQMATYLPLFGVLALVVTFLRYRWVGKQDPGDERMRRIASYISEGAMAFLKSEYKVLAIFVVVVAALLAVTARDSDSHSLIALSFVAGAASSGLAGFIGMRAATLANVRATQAAKTGLGEALKVAFAGGGVMGLSVVGLGVFGLSGLFSLYLNIFGAEDAIQLRRVVAILTGFSFGASLIALFARVGGGIYTKAADVGADLVGKVEAGIPEDHPLNPASIADNVGDNVGDVAGMGADLFESFVGAIIGAMALGAAFLGIAEFNGHFDGMGAALLPLAIAALGIVVSIIGTYFVRVREGGNPQTALNVGEFVSAGMMVVALYFLVDWMLPEKWLYIDQLYTDAAGNPIIREMTSLGVFFCGVVGVASGGLIGLFTEYYTGKGRGPVKRLAGHSVGGAATNLIGGLGLGMVSTVAPIVIIAAAIMLSFKFGALYGIAIAAVSMLSTLGIQLAVDAYGPISDNAGGIAEMAGLPPEVRERTDKLDAVGNTTAAIGKGFAIGSAALTGLALFGAYMTAANIKVIDISKAHVMAGLFLGGVTPLLFSALAMMAVNRAAYSMIDEVRRQFRENKFLKAALDAMRRNDDKPREEWSEEDKRAMDEADGKAEYGHCVKISTNSAIREMAAPGVIAIATPILTGFIGGAEMLGGMICGVTVVAVLMAIFQSNAGGAWDNAKKMVEEGVNIKGILYERGSEAHKAAVVGDTVGDPFKDTSGPSLNILLKLMSIVGLVIAPVIA